MLPRLDYGNATLVGLPANLLNRLHSVLNASARSIAGLRRSARISLHTLLSFARRYAARTRRMTLEDFSSKLWDPFYLWNRKRMKLGGGYSEC